MWNSFIVSTGVFQKNDWVLDVWRPLISSFFTVQPTRALFLIGILLWKWIINSFIVKTRERWAPGNFQTHWPLADRAREMGFAFLIHFFLRVFVVVWHRPDVFTVCACVFSWGTAWGQICVWIKVPTQTTFPSCTSAMDWRLRLVYSLYCTFRTCFLRFYLRMCLPHS